MDARRPGWIDPVMKKTSTTCQTSPHLSYMYIYIHYVIKFNHLHSSNEENLQNKRADLDGNFVDRSAVP